jgi:hypothetical protein
MTVLRKLKAFVQEEVLSMSVARTVALCSFVAVALVGCLAGDGTGVFAPPGVCNANLTPDPNLFAPVQDIFTDSCALSGCHAGANPSAGQSLSQGAAISNIVCVPSVEVARLFRVQAGNPDSSYLVLKVEGNAGAVGGVATQMPIGFPALTQQEVDAIRAWILAGAPPPN